MTLEITYSECKALRLAAMLLLDDDDSRSRLKTWQIEALEAALQTLPASVPQALKRES